MSGFINGILNSQINSGSNYVVGSDSLLYTYQQIQDAVDAAVADGASGSNWKNVFVTPKSVNYSGTITLHDGINLIGVADTGSTNCNITFGGITGTSGTAIELSGSSSALLAMTITQGANNFASALIGSGSTLSAFYCPFIATGAAPNCIDQRGAGDAGTFSRGACFALGNVTTINGTLTALSATTI